MQTFSPDPKSVSVIRNPDLWFERLPKFNQIRRTKVRLSFKKVHEDPIIFSRDMSQIIERNVLSCDAEKSSEISRIRVHMRMNSRI